MTTLTLDRVASITDVAGPAYDEWAAGLPPFYDRIWLEAYERAGLGDSRASYLVATRDDGSLAAVLPVYDLAASDPLGLLADRGQRPLLSHCWHCYDTRVAAAPAERRELLTRGLDVLAAEGTDFWLANVEADHAAELEELSGETARPMDPRWRLDLRPFPTHDEYLAARSRNQRRDLVRHRRRARAAGIVVDEGVLTARSAAEAARLCAAIACSHGTDWYYEQRKMALLLESLVDRPEYRLLTLRAGDELVAASVLMWRNGTLHLWAGGAAPGRRAHAFYAPAALLAEEISLAFDLGADWVEGGRSNGKEKRRFGFEAVPLRAVRWRLGA